MSEGLGTVVCRCEDLRDTDFDDTLRQREIASLEDLKRHTRATMGPCQGRVCRGWLARYWDQAVLTHKTASRPVHAANSVADLPWRVGTIPGHRPPVRPVLVSDLATLDVEEAAPWGDKEAP